MRLCFATQNIHKLNEVQAMLPSNITLVQPEDIGCKEELPETQATLEDNSLQKASYLFQNYHYDCFADDTGLEIEALSGEPGVYSARYAGEPKNPEANMRLVLEKLATQTNKKARFRTVITLIINGVTNSFEGILEGEIISNKRGEKGFGYDPIFIPKGFTKTLAEMTLEEKNKISHRAIAFQKLNYFLTQNTTSI
jgi:XTP/dITP diphosphohydrolase